MAAVDARRTSAADDHVCIGHQRQVAGRLGKDIRGRSLRAIAQDRRTQGTRKS
ncbi:MAG: hypothetical protein V9G23_03130 [Giesbergeria sp.]